MQHGTEDIATRVDTWAVLYNPVPSKADPSGINVCFHLVLLYNWKRHTSESSFTSHASMFSERLTTDTSSSPFVLNIV